MNKTEHLLVVLQEELAEVAIELLTLQHQVSKALRFGLNEQRDLPISNKERIEAEWNDLLGSIKKLQAHGISLTPDIVAIEKKMEKIEVYCSYAKEVGSMVDDDPAVDIERIKVLVSENSSLKHNLMLSKSALDFYGSQARYVNSWAKSDAFHVMEDGGNVARNALTSVNQ